jgi:glycosyltransferase involved in cell wall biosynthesis
MHVAIEGSTWINPRGYGRFTRELTRALLRKPGDCRFTLVLDSGAAQATDLPDMPRLVVPTERATTNAASASDSRSLGDVWKMTRALSGRAFDAVVFPTNYSFVPVRRGPRVIVVIHDALPEAMPQMMLGSRRARLFWGLKNRLACRRADVVATVSAASAREIRTRLPYLRRDPELLTEGASLVFTPEDAGDEELLRPYLPPGRPYVLFVGGLSRHKRVPELVRAFGRVVGQGRHDSLMLVLGGPDTEDTFATDPGGLDAALRDLGPARVRVIRPGFVPDETLAALYRRAVCTVLPSMAEGFGLPALESMACGSPLLVQRSAAVEEVCGDAAEYVANPSELAPALARLLDDPGRRQQLQRAGLERAREFSWDECAGRLMALIQRPDPDARP